MKSKRSCHEHCPVCGSKCIAYLTGDWDIKDPTTYVYECVCDNCDTEFEEKYYLEYKITEWRPI